ncbi:MAG: bifunctional oligoribonuclease/PAP phosphatase NrnA [Bacteroidales bacterium]|jgi:phosphoesterase RecJ-like protein|nr:bifunctional oligoribonuclease/PAP phosphatase NrnA [Bacteroidales bacterium]
MRKTKGKYSKLLYDFLKRSDNIVLVCHKNPDGDAIGSMLGLAAYLKKLGKKAAMVSPDPVQEFLLWMKNSDNIIVNQDQPGKAVKQIMEADLIVMLDLNHVDRTGKLRDHIIASKARKILIDHHPDPGFEPDLLISEPEFSSTAELLFCLVREMEGEHYLDMEFIEPVYVGMMTDTGNFSFGTFNGDTLREVALMLDKGLDKDAIARRVYDNFSINRLKLQGYAAYERLIYLEEYNTAYIYLYRADLDRFKHKTGDTEGFVNIPLSVKDVLMSALFIEKEDHIKISFRSKGDLDVNTFASEYFSGGGHKNAAGGRYKGTMEECLGYFEQVLGEVRSFNKK